MKWMMVSGYGVGAANIAAASNSLEMLQRYIDEAKTALDGNPIHETNTLRSRLHDIRNLATQAAHSGYPITGWSLEIQTLIGEFLVQESPTLKPRLANAFAGGTHLGWGYMRCFQGFQLDVVQTNIDDAALHLKAINDDGIPLSYATSINELSQKRGAAQAGHAKWKDVAALFEALRDDIINALPPP